MLDVITAEATRSETIGRLTDEAFTALHAAGLFGLLIPRCFGGLEAGAVEALETLEMLCAADGSTGWIVMACNVGTGTAATYLPDAGAKAVFGEHIPVIAGQGAPRGRAVADGDGYRLSGQWSYGSGLLHAEYLHTGGMLFENGKPSRALTFIVPVKQVNFLGNWDVVALRQPQRRLCTGQRLCAEGLYPFAQHAGAPSRQQRLSHGDGRINPSGARVSRLASPGAF